MQHQSPKSEFTNLVGLLASPIIRQWLRDAPRDGGGKRRRVV